MYIQKLTPLEMLYLNISLENTLSILKNKNKLLHTLFKPFHAHYKKTFSKDKDRIFNIGVFPKLDTLYADITDSKNFVDSFIG